MERKIELLTLALAIIFSVSILSTSSAQTVPASQEAGGLLRQEEDIRRQRQFEKKITAPRPEEEELIPEEATPAEAGPEILVEKIVVKGNTLLPFELIEDIVTPYEGKQLSGADIQKIVDLVTDEYRKRGYVTSRAYLPPQTIKKEGMLSGVLLIQVIEGRLGEVEIKGNRYFKTRLIEKKIRLTPHSDFDYAALQKTLVYINEHPDIKAKAVLAPGKAAGETDIIIEVTDRLPVHPGFEYDNWGSRYIDKDRFSATLEHNNLLGFGDELLVKYQMSEGDFYKLVSTRYVFPIDSTLDLGFSYAYNTLKLGREFEDFDAESRSEIYGIYANKTLRDADDMELSSYLGFDYKNIYNNLLGVETSRDRLRVVKAGLDLDAADKLGRTVVNTELNAGVPDILGGSPAKDPLASRAGAGGKFYKGLFNLFRLQPAFFSSSILWKNYAQYSNYNLPASEQFQIGGPVTVRGYPPAEFSGDKGYYTGFDWSFPPYLMPKSLRVPFSKDNLYDAFRFVLFYDWATTHLNKILAGDEKHRTLKSCGFGFRLNLSEALTARLEFGYPLGAKSSDGSNLQRWLEVTKKF